MEPFSDKKLDVGMRWKNIQVNGVHIQRRFTARVITFTSFSQFQVSIGGEEVYAKGSAVLLVQTMHRDPSTLFTSMLDLLLPPHITSNKALSFTGTRDTVQIPGQIISGVNGNCKIRFVWNKMNILLFQDLN
jgi:hypothetical protein